MARSKASRPSPLSITEFFKGAGDIWRAVGLILGHPSLWLWVLIPFVLNVLIFAGVAWGVWHFFGGWIDARLFASDAWWMDALGWLVSIVVGLVLLIASIFLFVPVATLVAIPFNDLLSEKVEVILTGSTVDESFSLRALWRGMIVGTKTGLRLTLKTLLLFIPVMLLYLTPVTAPFAPVLSALITIRFLALEFTSYSMDRRYYDYRQRDRFLRENRARTFGLGTMAFFIMLAPVLNALFIPVSAVAGTILFCETELKGRESHRQAGG